MPNQVVGTAYVRLRLLTDSIGKDIRSAVKKSDLGDVQLQVKADTEDADRKLENTSKKAKDAEKNLGLMGTAIATLAPTIAPLAEASVAALAGVGAAAGVTVLAVLGVKKEMQNATVVGQQYAAGLDTLKKGLGELEKTAADKFLGAFERTVTELNRSLPGVNKAVGQLSVTTADLATHLAVGLIVGIQTFEPLMQHVVILADQASQKFEAWATGPGGAQFAGKLGAAFDQVVPVLTNLALAIERVAAAAGPLGSSILSTFSLLSKIILALPMPVLQTLILGIVTLKTALTGLAIVDKLKNSFEDFSKTAGKVGVTSLAGRFTLLGLAGGLAGAALFGLSQIMDENAKHAQYVAKLTQDYTQALEDNNGALNANVTQTVIQDSVTAGIAKTLAQAGISTQQWVNAIQLGGPALTDLSNKLLKSTGPAHLLYSTLIDQRDAFKNATAEAKTYTDANDAANRALAQANPLLAQHAAALGLTAVAYQTAQTALAKKVETDKKNYALQQIEIAQNYQLAGTQDQLAKNYGITTAQVQSYAAMLGITQKQVEDGQVSYLRYSQAVREVHDAYANATQSGQEFLTALDTFSKSAGTAADRAALIGATLKAANGDALDYAASMNSSAVAADNLAQQVGKTAVKVIDLKTGTIDYTKAAAGPLIQGLQAIQTAAMGAAQAQFQHEVSTKGAKTAADDAYSTYKAQTQGQLVDEATKLGLTSKEAQKLADKYFGMPKDVKTKIEAIGTDPVVSVLNKIGQQLSYLTGRAWDPKVGVQDNATSALAHIRDRLAALDGKTSTVYVREVQQLSKQAALGQAMGFASGGSLPEGWSTVGEGNPNTWEMVHKHGSNVRVYSNRASKAMGGAVGAVPGFATGTTAAALAAANRAYGSAVTLRIKIDDRDLYSLRRSLGGSVAQVAGAMHTLILDAQKAANMIPGRRGQYSTVEQIENDNTRLLAAVHQRNVLTEALKQANTRLADLQKASAQERATVASAVVGGFNVTTAGQFSVGGNNYQTAAGILLNLRQQVTQANAFAANLAKLRRRGLSTALLRQIGESGYASGGSAAAALAGASAAQIGAINRQYAQLGAAGQRAGTSVANAMFAKQIAAQQAVVHALERRRQEAANQVNRLANEIARLAKSLANRPVVLTANGRELARVVNNQNAANARR